MLSNENTSSNDSANILIRRQDIILRIFSAFAYSEIDQQNNFSIYGLPRIGKTFILRHLSSLKEQKQFEVETSQDLSRCIFVYIDLEAFLMKTFEEFFETLSRYIVKQSQEKLLLTYNAEMRADGFTDVLDQICEQRYRLVLLMDMFDEIVQNDQIYQILAFLRAHATMGKVSYVAASNASLYDICLRKVAGSPFFNIFYDYLLEALAYEEAQELIGSLAQQAGMSLTEVEKEQVLHYTGRHPFFIERFCSALGEENGKVDEQRVKGRAYKSLLSHFTDIWEFLTEEERFTLKDEAQQNEKMKDNRPRNLPELSESALFRQFVRNKLQVGLFRMSIDDLEDALNHLNDLVVLGETNLRLLKIVTQRLNDDVQSTSIEKGKVIREVLLEAFERMRGSGTRSEAAPDWLHYNILYYRYFQHHLKNKVIADRLGYTSDRQYFRDRKKAIGTLRTILLRME
jgi:Novel STAND NTPase 2